MRPVRLALLHPLIASLAFALTTTACGDDAPQGGHADASDATDATFATPDTADGKGASDLPPDGGDDAAGDAADGDDSAGDDAAADGAADGDDAQEADADPDACGAAESCNEHDDDCDGLTDEDWRELGPPCPVGQGACAAQGTVVCGPDGAGTTCAAVAGTPAATEVCGNGVDDDCDGQTDEGCDCDPGETEACGTDEGECVAGTRTCGDGGQWGPCEGAIEPTVETCNDLDDDCDGLTDESDGTGAAHDNGCGGVCPLDGTPGAPCDGPDEDLCPEGTWSCDGLNAATCSDDTDTAVEVCDGAVDDDCDGATDEGCGCVDGSTQPCGSDVGRCQPGAQTCQGGVWGPCEGGVGPQAETCNDLDDDCDGETDEAWPSKGGNCTAGLGECFAKGVLVCDANGLELACSAQPAEPTDEVCNGLDDDCNGLTDDGNPGGGAACATGLPGVCAAGTIQCVAGRLGCQAHQTATEEVCNGLDDDCDGLTDEDVASAGVPCETGLLGVCAAGTMVCAEGTLSCVAHATAGAETCNGLDDDCDGLTDEGDPGGGGACATGNPGPCAAGTLRCLDGELTCVQSVQPQPETCNLQDDDCDGLTDEDNAGGGFACGTGQPGVCAAGTTVCTNGRLVCQPNKAPTAETCNGLDDDCDGQTDEGNPGAGQACATGQPGLCGNGQTACLAGTIACLATVGPSMEACDGLDNDCDGETDEGNPGAGFGCQTNLPGVCAQGTTTCLNGVPTCLPNVQPSPEICDGYDNDCDGAVDENNPGGGESCDTSLPGPCAAGVTLCTGGGLTCEPLVTPAAEVCDGVDNNCNGVVDENNPGGGASCDTGLLGVCATGATACVGGSLKCQATVSPATEICNGLDDDCDGQIDENACACAHDTCTNGTALAPNCSPCVAAICAVDPYCCTTAWDVVCIDEVASVCGSGVCAGSCAHPVCSTGTAMQSGCNACVSAICSADPYCCNTSWDSLCVGAVPNLCGLSCQ